MKIKRSKLFNYTALYAHSYRCAVIIYLYSFLHYIIDLYKNCVVIFIFEM